MLVESFKPENFPSFLNASSAIFSHAFARDPLKNSRVTSSNMQRVNCDWSLPADDTEIFSRLGLEDGFSRRVKLDTRAEKTRCSRRLGLAPPCFVNLCTGSPRNVCVFNRLLFYSNCTGFTFCFTYNGISLSMYRNQC